MTGRDRGPGWRPLARRYFLWSGLILLLPAAAAALNAKWSAVIWVVAFAISNLIVAWAVDRPPRDRDP